jgi:hypothetical protein
MLVYLSFRRLGSALLGAVRLFRLLSYLPGTFECGEYIARPLSTLLRYHKVRGPR